MAACRGKGLRQKRENSRKQPTRQTNFLFSLIALFSSFFSLLNAAEQASIQLKEEDKFDCFVCGLWAQSAMLPVN